MKYEIDILKTIEQRTGFPIIEDSNIVLTLFGSQADFIQGAYVMKHQTFLKKEAVLLTPSNKINKFAILFHELAHATGIEGRLERIGLMRGGFDYNSSSICKRVEESVAETTSMLLMEHFKLATYQTRAIHNTYLLNYSVSSDFQDMIRKQSNEAKDYILTHWLHGLQFNPIIKELNLMERIKEFMKVA